MEAKASFPPRTRRSRRWDWPTWWRSASPRRKSSCTRAIASDPIALAQNSPALLLIQRIRDEAHRFAITFHRQSRAKRDLRSALDQIPGVGPRRRKALLIKFGSLAGVRRANREELTAVVGTRCADAVLAHFASS